MNNIYKLPCVVYSIGWATTEKIDINLDEWIYFEVELRCGAWFIRGHKVENDKWISKDLSRSGVVNDKEMAKFISQANHYPESKGKYQSCKVSCFNNLHYSGDFYFRLEKLLREVRRVEEEYPPMPDLWE